jgi:hypothetical protein
MRQINRCINKQLVAICEAVMHLDTLNTQIKHYLPPYLAENCRAGSFSKGRLTLVVSPIWATELHYKLPELRDRLRKEGKLYQLTSIKIAVECDAAIHLQENSNKKSLSNSALLTIRAASQHFTYEPLKLAWESLAREKVGEES